MLEVSLQDVHVVSSGTIVPGEPLIWMILLNGESTRILEKKDITVECLRAVAEVVCDNGGPIELMDEGGNVVYRIGVDRIGVDKIGIESYV